MIKWAYLNIIRAIYDKIIANIKLNDKKIKEIDYKVVKRRKETFHREEYTDGK